MGRPTYSVELTRDEIEIVRNVIDEMAQNLFGNRSISEPDGKGFVRSWHYTYFKDWRILAQADSKLFEALPPEIRQSILESIEGS